MKDKILIGFYIIILLSIFIFLIKKGIRYKVNNNNNIENAILKQFPFCNNLAKEAQPSGCVFL